MLGILYNFIKKTYSVNLSPEYLSEKCKQSMTSEYLLI